MVHAPMGEFSQSIGVPGGHLRRETGNIYGRKQRVDEESRKRISSCWASSARVTECFPLSMLAAILSPLSCFSLSLNEQTSPSFVGRSPKEGGSSV